MKSRRRWFFVGSDYGNVALIDLTRGICEAFVEPQIIEDECDECTESWQAKETEEQYVIAAFIGDSTTKEFPYDPEDEDSYKDAIDKAVTWVNDTIGPPTIRRSAFEVWLRSLMFWKYKAVRADGKLVGLMPREAITK